MDWVGGRYELQFKDGAYLKFVCCRVKKNIFCGGNGTKNFFTTAVMAQTKFIAVVAAVQGKKLAFFAQVQHPTNFSSSAAPNTFIGKTCEKE